MPQAPPLVGGQARDPRVSTPGGGPGRPGRIRRRGRTPKSPPPEAGLLGCSGGGSCGCPLLGSLATRALAPPSGRPVRKQEAGAACALLVCSPAALGPALRGCCSTRRFAGGQLLSAPPARSSTRPPPQPLPVASTPTGPLPPRLISGRRRRRPSPDGSVQRRLQGQSLAWGVPGSPLPDGGKAPGPGSHRAGPFPASSPQPASGALRPWQRRVGEPPVGACGMFSPRERQVLC